MNVFRNIDELQQFNNAVITIGTFDGVHLGHQQIISRINQIAKDNAGESVIITFHPHPRLVIQPDGQAVQLLSTPNEKIELLKKYGVNNVVIIPFSRDFSEQSAEHYIEHFLVKNFQPKHIVIGYVHKFGRDRKGDFTLLEKYKTQFGYTLEEINKQTLEDITISSTKIRHALNEGEIEQANELLGHAYTLSGIVIKGLQNGRKLGYPTANIQPDEFNKLIPKKGIYAVRVRVDERWYGGMLSIGFNPTFGGKHLSVEVNILNFSREIYGQRITIEFIQYIRDEKKFESMEALIKGIDGDKVVITAILQQHYKEFGL